MNNMQKISTRFINLMFVKTQMKAKLKINNKQNKINNCLF